MKPQEMATARMLRRGGMPLKKIAATLSVSPGSVHRWCADLRLTLEQEAAIDRNLEKTAAIGRRRANERVRMLATWRLHENMNIGRQQIGDSISDRDLLMLGIGLYMGEGDKRKRGTVGVVNMDAAILRLFIRWLSLFDVSISRLSAHLHLAPEADEDLAITMWCSELGIQRSVFGKTTRKISPSSKRKTYRPGYKGVLTLRINSTVLYDRIAGMIDRVAAHSATS